MSISDNINDLEVMIKSGILERDWNYIKDAYLILTGNDIELPEEEGLIKEMMRRLERLEKGSKTETPPKKPSKVQNKTKEQKVEPAKSNGRINKFEEMAKELNLEIKKENGFDKINDNVPPTPRTRKPYTPVTLTCTRCKKTEEVNPMFKKDDYRCNNCIGK